MGKVLRQGALAALAIALLIGIFGAPATALAKKFSPVGAVYVMSNNTTNTVMVFKRNSKGALKPSGSVKTGGMGSGSGLGSQGALAFSGDGKYLLAVNAGSADISVFMIGRYGDLKKVNEVSSEGTMPVSITSRGQWVYVLDRGGSGNIAGFSINKHGHLTFLAGSMQHLSNLGVGASPVAQQISFKPRSNLIVVTELSTNMIDVYALAAGGVAGAPTVQLSIGTAPYGFGFTHSGTLIVSNAASATLSSYKVSASTLSVVSSAVPDFQLAPCWVVVSPDGTHAYTADAHSNDISIYNVKSNGKISLEKSAAVKPSTPLDLAMTGNGKFLYALATGAHRVAAYGVKKHGLLKGLGSVGLLPTSATRQYARPRNSRGLGFPTPIFAADRIGGASRAICLAVRLPTGQGFLFRRSAWPVERLSEAPRPSWRAPQPLQRADLGLGRTLRRSRKQALPEQRVHLVQGLLMRDPDLVEFSGPA